MDEFFTRSGELKTALDTAEKAVAKLPEPDACRTLADLPDLSEAPR